jgi:N-acetylglutamate synthase-like GNAT family acetyltransferase
MIRKCKPHDIEEIFAVINDAAQAYNGVIPEDRWREPYMPMEELKAEIRDGIDFWCLVDEGQILGVMGIQDKGHVTLIRHAYVRTSRRRSGIGTQLLRCLEGQTGHPILIGTWQAARWAIRFYERNGYTAVSREETDQLLKRYWNIPERQIETSVVLAKGRRSANKPEEAKPDSVPHGHR